MDSKVNDDKPSVSNRALDIGTVEKLNPKYGFIKCLGRKSDDRSIFFHSSGTLMKYTDLSIGDRVTYERIMTNGKPLATNVQLSDEIIDGTIVRTPKSNETGSISYEVNGESFFVSFEKDDVAEETKLRSKDEVTFKEIKRDGKAYASCVRRKFNKPSRVQGIVTAVKEKFGFIDRSDKVKDIYFNLSATPNGFTMEPGVELEFNVKHLRNGKEEAVNLKVLKKGTVKFFDVIDTVLYGTLLRSPEARKSTNADILSGSISYVGGSDGKVLQIPFGERDKKYSYTLHPGDIVAFKVAIDHRDQLQRACDVQLSLGSFPSRKEIRHLGVIKILDGISAGLIEPDQPLKSNEDNLVAFKSKEWIPTSEFPKLVKFQPVSYTPVQSGSNNGSLTAVRIYPISTSQPTQFKHLKLYRPGSLRGIIQTFPNDFNDLGIIVGICGDSDLKRSIAFTLEDVDPSYPFKVGDEVEFGCLDRDNSKYTPPTAFDIHPFSSSSSHSSRQHSKSITTQSSNSGNLKRTPSSKQHSSNSDEQNAVLSRKQRSRTLPDNKVPEFLLVFPSDDENQIENISRGWIVILKDKFGLIESEDHNSLFQFNPIKTVPLQLDSFVQFSVYTKRGNRPLAKSIQIINTEITKEKLESDQFTEGEIIRPLSLSINTQYPGLIREIKSGKIYSYSMKSLVSFFTKLNTADRVFFKKSSNNKRGVCIASIKQVCRVKLHEDFNQITLIREGSSLNNNGTDNNHDNHEMNSSFENPLPPQFEVKLSDLKISSDKYKTDQLVEALICLNDDTNKIGVSDIRPIRISTQSTSSNSLSTSNSSMKNDQNDNNAMTPTSATSRKPLHFFKQSDETGPRILHIRSPRLPIADSIGFSNELKSIPELKVPV